MPSLDVRMLGVDGSETTIGDVRARRGTLVIFTCNHCPWAQAWEGRLTALGNRYMARGVGVIAINSNDPAAYSRALYERMRSRAASAGVEIEYSDDGYEEMVRRARAAGVRFPYVVDATSQVARSFGATRTPEVFLFDSDARLVYRGAVDDHPFEPDQIELHYLADALERLVDGRDIARPVTRSIGCAIAFRTPDE